MNPPEPRIERLAASPAGTPAAEFVLSGLNPSQREAVTWYGGPMLVLAGAGSGKTRVITQRIADLILNRGTDPTRIFAVTFTNKAAGEMRERVAGLLSGRETGSWIGTFHALGLRILRRDGGAIGLPAGFTVLDTDDQLALVRRLLADEMMDDSGLTPRKVLSWISRAKNDMRPPRSPEHRDAGAHLELLERLYSRYQDSLRRLGVVDFDDLILLPLELLEREADLAARYADRCEHLLVDEYQDTNRPQYLLVRALSSRHGNVCVVGDEDQSIYRFRGAEIRNILDFESDFPRAKTIKLEQNYRSTRTILDVAGAVISRNTGRKGKVLWTDNPEGDRVEMLEARDDRGEAAWIARRVDELRSSFPLEGIAVLYRTNAQSRPFEEAFRGRQLPYRIVGSVGFYERREVKDVLAYLKLAANASDDVSLRRVLNTPARGLGEATLKTIEDTARREGLALKAAAARAVEHGLLPGRTAKGVAAFLRLIDDLTEQIHASPVTLLLNRVLSSTDYQAYLMREFPENASDRIDNVKALVSAAAEYQEESDGPSLQEFLDRSALVSDADEIGGGPGVTLMTIHCAKGLEFPVVFLAGLEERLFPHALSTDSADDLEEERRLCYVAMTRAQQRLVLSFARQRRVQGVYMPSEPSRFTREIPAELLHTVVATDDDAASRRGEFGFGPRMSPSSALRAASRREAREAPAPRYPAGPPPEDGWAVGARICHPSFGSGQIVDREGSGRTLKLTIRFAECGTKVILPAYVRLELVSSAGTSPSH